MFAGQVLGLSLPRTALYAVVLLTLVSNIALEVLNPRGVSFSPNGTGAILVFDTTLLALLLYFSGGSSNPFSTLFLVHITLAAVVLGSMWTWLLAALATTYYVLLFRFHVPVSEITHEHGMHMGDSYSLHLQGMLIAFVLTAALIVYFLDKVTRELRRLEQERFDQSRLASLATLSAGAAHELGSPLAAISIASDELELAGRSESVNVALLRELSESIATGVRRCKGIIERMGGALGRSESLDRDSFTLSELVMELREDLSLADAKRVDFRLPLDSVELRSHFPMLKRCLYELLRNALDSSPAPSAVVCEMELHGDSVRIAVRDAGVGIRFDEINRVKEPFYTKKEVGDGMGLGLYLVELFTKSMKGRFQISSSPQQGTCAELFLPRAETSQKVLRRKAYG